MEKTRMFTFAGRVIKNLFKKPATTQYPFEPVEYPERMRGHIRIEIENCITCGLCMRSCPSQAIRVDRKAGTWTIERFDCVQCGFCVATCPKKCLGYLHCLRRVSYGRIRSDQCLPRVYSSQMRGSLSQRRDNV